MAELEGAGGPDVLELTLRRAAEAGEVYLEVDEGAGGDRGRRGRGGALGRSGAGPARSGADVGRRPRRPAPPALPGLARRALLRVTADPERSEVRGLWDDAAPEDRDAWRARVADLDWRLHER